MEGIQQRIFQVLSESPDFQGFSPQELREISAISRIASFAAGEEVFTIDHTGQSVFIVASGRLRLRLKSRQIKDYLAGELFGEIAVLSNRGRLGTIQCVEAAELVVIDKSRIFASDLLNLTTRLNLIMTLTQKMISYFYQEEPPATERLLQQTPSETLSFLPDFGASHRVEILQTIAAFLNQRGGTLLLGVDPSGTATGRTLRKATFDQFRDELVDELKAALRSDYADHLHFDVESVGDKPLIRIDVDPATQPVFFWDPTDQAERFIIRSGASNTLLRLEQQISAFLEQRFQK